MKEGWLDIKGCHSTDDMKARNVVTSMVVLSSTQNLTTMGQLMGMNLRILSKGQSKRIQLQEGANMEWASVI
jgi:phosphate starvation-inducible protein PhoH